MIENLTTATPVEIDTVLFPLRAERYYQHEAAVRLRHTLAKTIWPAEYKERYERYLRNHESKVYPLDLRFRGERQVISHVERLNETMEKFDAANKAIEPLEAEYDRRGGWTRFLLVSAGHIHFEHHCGSIRPTTQVAWLIEASGSDADKVVAKYNYTACTKCFPNAPVLSDKPLDPNVCTGSGQGVKDVNGSLRLYRRWGACNVCGTSVSATSLGNARKHNTPTTK